MYRYWKSLLILSGLYVTLAAGSNGGDLIKSGGSAASGFVNSLYGRSKV